MVPLALRSENQLRQKKTPKHAEPDSKLVEPFEDFRVKNEPAITTKLFWWMREQIPLAEAFFVALSIHVVAFPVIWCLGWALPWPKSAVITTIIEYDLTDWAKGKHTPKRVFEFRDPKLNQ